LSFRQKIALNIHAILNQTAPVIERTNTHSFEKGVQDIIKAEKIDHVILELSYLIPLGVKLRKQFPQLKITLSTENVEYLLFRQLARQARNPIVKVQKYLFARNLMRLE